MSKYNMQDPLELDGLDDEEDLTDDEVFTEGGKSGPFEENGVSKPLMAPRNRNSKGTSELLHTRVRKVPPFRVIWGPLMYGVVALTAVLGIIALVVFVINTLVDRFRSVPPIVHRPPPIPQLLKSCSNISVEEVWAKTFPMLTTESAIRLVDANQDGVLDLVIGFGTGVDAFKYPPIVCDIYFSRDQHCGGGLMALDGINGRELWRYYTAHEIFAVNCNVDLDGDLIKDCLGGGRMAGLVAVSGRDGKLLWIFNDPKVVINTSNVYTPLYVRDLDNDSVPDLVVVHGGDPTKDAGRMSRLVGRLVVMSGKTGKVLQWAEVPDKMESYYSPQLLIHPDGSEMILFGTGGETHGGSLWCLGLSDLMLGKVDRAKAIYTDSEKGIMTPPVLVDLTGDGVTDIVMAMFNSTVYAYNGLTFEQIWKTKFPSSETYSTPGIGFFNNDTVPDFIVNYHTGAGFPVYYYTQTTILNGKGGEPLMPEPVKMVVGTQSSPLVISSQGYGNDIFLYWTADCHGNYAGKELEFDFVEGTTVHQQSRSDFCHLRFREKLYTRLYAMTQSSGVPGTVIYDSDTKKSQEFGHQLNYTALGLQFLEANPKYLPRYYQYLENSDDLVRDKSSSDSNKYDLHNIQGGMGRYPGGSIPVESGYEDDRDPGSYYGQPRSHLPPLRGSAEYPEDNRYYGDDQIENPWANPDSDTYRDRRIQRPQLSRVQNARRNSHRPRWKKQSKKRKKRHVGIHDGGGIQRTISTGTLVPSIGTEAGYSMDIIYATFWFYPAKTQALFPEDERCIKRMLSLEKERERFKVTNEYYKLDHDAYEEAVTAECLKKSGHYSEESSTTSEQYNPFDRQMGQMTVYRTRLKCVCEEPPCAQFLPFQQQGWPSYMGHEANCLFRPRPPQT